MSGPEVEIDDSGVTSTLNTKNIFYVHRVGGAIQLQVYRVADRYICNLLWVRR